MAPPAIQSPFQHQQPNSSEGDQGHQIRTQNNPMTIIREEEAEPPIIAPISNDHFPKRQVNGKLIGSKRNHARHVSRKRIQKIIDAQMEKDKLMDIRKGINQIIDEGSKNYNNNSPPPEAKSLVAFHHVNLKGSNSPPPGTPTITQDYPSQHSNQPAVLPPLPGAPNVCGTYNPMECTSSTPTRSISLSAAPCSIHIQLFDQTATPLTPPWQRH